VITSTARPARPVGVRAVFAVAEFRALWLSGLVSRLGDVLARVAVTVLAYERTGSASITGLTFALTLLPGLLGGPLLAGFADRFPRRSLMLTCAMIQAILVVCMLAPAVPFIVVCALLFVVQLLDSPDKAARLAVLPQVLDEAAYPLGLAVNQITWQLANVAGFAVGGVVVAALGSHGALAVDAVTFVVAALIVFAGTRHRPAARVSSGASRRRGSMEPLAGVRLIAADPRLRCLLGLALIAGFDNAPLALTVPYGSALGMSTSAIGLLYAAMPVGAVVGMFVYTRWVGPEARSRMMGPMAVLACLPFVACALHPGPLPSIALWAVSGMFTAYQVTASAEFARIVPNDRRGQTLGLAAAALTGVQGIGMALAGAVADAVSPATTAAIFGAAGALVAVPLGLALRQARSDAEETVRPQR
jgi:predicted MFS family arabinose efflux permease